VSTDPVSARECQEEARILKHIAPHCIEDTGGLFVAVPGDDENYVADFPDLCARAGLTCQPMDPGEARDLEPGLARDLIAAYAVNDATIDPFQISLDNISQAIDNGATYLSHHQVTALERNPNQPIKTARLQNILSGAETLVHPGIVVNASGAWSGQTLNMAGLDLRMHYAKGTLAVTATRLSRRVLNRLRPPGDGDILVPGGTVSILGTTSVKIQNLTSIRPTIEEVDTIVEEGAAMFPSLETTRYVRSYAGVRPLLENGGTSGDRNASRGYVLIDHASEGCPNLITLTGGKLTTFRLMAERGADLVAEKLGVESPCLTRTHELPSSRAGQWSEAGRSSRTWARQAQPQDLVLCECEMIPQSHFDQILKSLDEHNVHSELNAFRLRSRLGKGACQGTFCSVRLTNSMVDQQRYSGPKGLEEIRKFISSRWVGQRPVLWDGQLCQAELSEAIHCGLFGLELHQGADGHGQS
jgi:glycerol-3-phosphate dehydrogenase